MVSLRQSEIFFIAGQVVSEIIERQGNALIETVAGSERLQKVAEQYENCASSYTQGRMFEIIEMTKFNAASAKAGNLLRAVTTDQLGEPHAAADLLIRNANGDVMKEIQAKSYEKAAATTHAIAKPKYNGMDRLVNKENEDKVNELIEKRMNTEGIYAQNYRDAHGSVKGQTEYGDIQSGGTTHKEALQAAEDPNSYTSAMNRAELFNGARNAMVSGVLAGAFVGGTITAAQGAFNKEFSAKETGKAAAYSAARGAVVSGVAYGLKYLGKNHPLMSGNIVTTLASAAISTTELGYQFLSGKISTEELVEGLGSNALTCFSGIVMTAAGAALFGPIGAAVSATVALIGMKQLYSVFANAREDLQLTIEARQKAEELSAAMILEIKAEEERLISYYQEYETTFAELKKLVDVAVLDDSITEQAIVALAEGLSVGFEYETFEVFEEFMLSDGVLDL
ncbi:hypothetical protein CSV61_06700 [Sporosarcina sp. P3]|uniref:hypothetical protein n=1 Tax=Sporosarcina sp. P3 TaxID=2048245 RepID=UPI000C170CA0|nr:hypothetical protein [Sporosarcina sp. P3]PID21902.1 hypothetical protein CSV61_06700 [Sporosarcina sp. P3]